MPGTTDGPPSISVVRTVQRRVLIACIACFWMGYLVAKVFG